MNNMAERRKTFDNARDKMEAIIRWLDYQEYEITVLCDTMRKAEKLYDMFQNQDIFGFADTVWYHNEDEEYSKEAEALRKKMSRLLKARKIS